MNALALGTNASVSAGNSVALGADATANQGAVASYAAFGLPGTQSSVGEVSIGSAGAARQLTNLAPGQNPTDAVNVWQLRGTASNLGTGMAAALGGGAGYNTTSGTFTAPSFTIGGNTYTTVSGALAGLQSGLSSGALGLLQQDATSRLITVGAATDGSRISLAGTTGPRQITGVADGTVANGSSDAVTGNQLSATNQAVAANASSITTLRGGFSTIASTLGGGASYDPATGTLTAPTFTVAGNAYHTVSGAIAAEDVQVGSNTTAIANLQTSVASGGLGLVRQDATSRLITIGAATDGNRVSVAGTGGARQVTGVADGTVASGSSDVVTGNQLSATNQAVAANTSGITALRGGFSTVASTLGGGASYDPTTGTLTAPTFTVKGNAYHTVSGAIAAEDVQVGSNTTAIANLQTSVASGGLGLVRQDATSRLITIGAATDGNRVSVAGTGGARQVTGVADGTVASGSSDVVTGNQLSATNQVVAANTAGLATVGGGLASAVSSLGGGASYDAATGVFTAPSFTVGGNSYNTVSGALAAEDGRVNVLSTSVTNMQASPSGLVQQNGGTITVASTTAGNSVSVAGAGGTRLVSGVSNGAVTAGSDQAVTGSQLYSVNQSVLAMNANLTQLAARIAQINQGGSNASSTSGADTPFRSNAGPDTNTGAPVASAMHSTAGGYAAMASQANTTAIGYGAQASVDGATAIGSGAVATADPTVAVGTQTRATGNEASALGAYAEASGANTTAIGRSATASGTNATALGMDASATGNDSVAIGQAASAAQANAVAIGAGAKTTRANQVTVGKANQTYTMPGLPSFASTAAQQGATGFVTTDAAGNLAMSPIGPADVADFGARIGSLESNVATLERGIRRANEGASIAIAMSGAVLPGDKRYALTANVGTYAGEAGVAASGFARLTDSVAVNAGVGIGLGGHNVAARGGMTFAW